MKVKCTKVMATEINKHFKNNSKYNGYEAYISKTYDFFDGDIQVIKISYPYNFYACDAILDDSDLLKIYKKSDKTYNGFFATLLEEVEI